MNNRISIDVDGVLADFDKAFIQVAHKIWPARFPTNYVVREWNFGLSNEEQDRVWKDIIATPNFWLSLDAYPAGVGALAKFMLTRTAYDVWFVTSRTPTEGLTVAMQTEMWLGACGVPRTSYNYRGIVTVVDPSRKASIFKAVGIEWSIDDKTETVEQCDKLDPKWNHKAYLLDQPWNQNAQVKRRVKTVAEFLSDIP